MNKILYSSVDAQGKAQKGFIEARGNHEALELLKQKGHSQIRFYADGALSIDSDQELLAPYDDHLARFQIEIRHRPGFYPVLLQSLYRNRFVLLFGILLILGSWYFDYSVALYFGVAIVILVPLLTAWAHRASIRYEKMLANFAVGNWEGVLQDRNFLRKHEAGLEMGFDLDIREAIAQFKLSGDTAAVQALEKWRDEFDKKVPGYFEMRMASVQHALGHPQEFIEMMRAAFAQAPTSSIIVTDLALGEARLGDVDKAQKLLKTIPAEELPIEGEAFVHWIAGLVAYRSGRSGATEFESALRYLSQFGESPSLWPSIAVCVGDWAIYASPAEWAAFELDDKVRAVWRVLETHSEAATVKRIRARLDGAGGEPQTD